MDRKVQYSAPNEGKHYQTSNYSYFFMDEILIC